MIYIKIHETEHGAKILAMCDKSLIGKVLEEGNVYIDLKLYSDFYTGELIDEEEGNIDKWRFVCEHSREGVSGSCDKERADKEG